MPKQELVTQDKAGTALREAQPEDLPVVSPAPATGFFNFSYSVTQVSTHGDRTHVKSSQTRFEHGKLTSESFEGELERGAYDGMVRQAQQVVADQTALMMKSLSWFFGPRSSDEQD